MIGQTISHYHVVERIGEGGMGVVYRAEDTRLGRSVALKFLPLELSRDPEARERFKREARAASALDQDNVCVIHDIDETPDGRLFIAMAWYEGRTLKSRLADGPFEIGEAVDVARQIAAGLEIAHDHGIVHRDIKPANIMITARGDVRILDFGIAKLAGEVGLTRTGSTLGTLSYMAPEQVEGRDVGPFTDLWSLGVVLYEMITGEPPFVGSDQLQTMTAILMREPVPPERVRPGVSADLAGLVMKLLRKDPALRPASTAEVRRRLDRSSPRPSAPRRPVWRRPAVWAFSTVAVAAVLLAIFVPAWLEGPRDRALASLPMIEALTLERRFVEAYALAERATDVLGADHPTLARVWPEISEVLTVRSDPEGAEVHILGFSDPPGRTGPSEGRRLGTTPLDGLRIPRDDYILTVEMDGYAPVELLFSTDLAREQKARFQTNYELSWDLHLVPEDSVPPGMVLVPGGDYTLVSADAPAGASVDLTPYFMDRFEVTNADHLEFVQAGGYDDASFWPDSIVDEAGRPLTLETARRRFVDQTLLPGPRGWTGQRYPEAKDRHPVTDVTWYEAAAYCAFRGGSLPTIFEWEKAARQGRMTRFEGLVLPWGLVHHERSTERRANFEGTGTGPVDEHPFGMSGVGVYAMAGNVREWTLNATENGHIAMGASWRDPSYVFTSIATPEPMTSSSALGFRCVRRTVSGDRHGGAPLSLERRSPSYEPVDLATYRSFLTHYRYDPVELNPEILARTDTDDWERLRVGFNGPEGERILAYLYLPKSVPPPYQTLVFVPGSNVFSGSPVDNQTEWVLGPIIRSGRAVFSVVMEGMVERPWPPGRGIPASHTVGFRDLMVKHATELRLGLDYLTTRDDVAMDRIAYVGLSWGAGSRSLFAAVDERFGAVIFVGAGIDERVHPTVPEALNVNFLPRIGAPTLMVNGRQDEEHPWLTRALPFWELLSEPKELVLVDDEGHVPSLRTRVPAINGFLDRMFGPVR